MGQSAVLDHLATKLAATNAGVTKAQVLEAFGVDRQHHHDMGVQAGQQIARVVLTHTGTAAMPISEVIKQV